MNVLREKYSVYVAVILICICYAVWLAYPITLESLDLGRLLKTGELFIQNPEARYGLLYTNFFSYTNTDYLAINHHWLSGVVFYLFHSVVGFTGLHIIFIALHILALLLCIDVARKLSSEWIAVVITVPMLILIMERFEVRPEGFEYLFSALVLWLLTKYKLGEIQKLWLWCIPLIIALWVNLHVSFPIGLGIIGAFLITSPNEHRKTLLIIFTASCVGTLLNPSGIHGALYPFLVVQDHGLMIVENQSILFLESVGYSKASFWYVKMTTLLLIAATAILLKAKRIQAVLPYILIAAAITILAWFGARHITLLGFVLIPTLAGLYTAIITYTDKYRSPLIIGALTWVVISSISYSTQVSAKSIGIGLDPESPAAAEFLMEQSITGPYFHNFDIAGYLTYYMFPEEQVFTDNRPEAHPPEFFTETYIPILSKEPIWQQKSVEYGFNAIVIYYRDRSEWIPAFIQRRLQDPRWIPVFADRSVLIFLRPTVENAPIISKYAISPDTFVF